MAQIDSIAAEYGSEGFQGKVVLLLDSDDAGQAATQRVIEQLFLCGRRHGKSKIGAESSGLPRNADIKGGLYTGEKKKKKKRRRRRRDDENPPYSRMPAIFAKGMK